MAINTIELYNKITNACPEIGRLHLHNLQILYL